MTERTLLKIGFVDGRAPAVTLEAPGITIGKASANDIIVDADGVNGFHADLRVDGDAVTIADVNTALGTRVNGVRIDSATLLKVGDVITIGDAVFEISPADTAAIPGSALAVPPDAGWALVVDSGSQKGEVIPVTDRTRIGRALDCDISIQEPRVSRQHAELVLQGPELLLRDLGSVNGSKVNDEKVRVASLKDQDVLQFGNARFIVRAP